eukprot:3483972-Amphidinium_carterae.2
MPIPVASTHSTATRALFHVMLVSHRRCTSSIAHSSKLLDGFHEKRFAQVARRAANREVQRPWIAAPDRGVGTAGCRRDGLGGSCPSIGSATNLKRYTGLSSRLLSLKSWSTPPPWGTLPFPVFAIRSVYDHSSPVACIQVEIPRIGETQKARFRAFPSSWAQSDFSTEGLGLPSSFVKASSIRANTP